MISLICGIQKKKRKRKKDTNEVTSKTERDSQTKKTNLWLLKGKGGWDFFLIFNNIKRKYVV